MNMAFSYHATYRRPSLAQPHQPAEQDDDATLVLSRAEMCRAIGETFLREAHQRATGAVSGRGKPIGRDEPRPARPWRILAASGLLGVALLFSLALFGWTAVAQKTSAGEKPAQFETEESAFQPHHPTEKIGEDLPQSAPQPQGKHGTGLDFACTPAEAAKRAGDQGKLVFLLHISGNFEDSGFT
jgi:hypothetical protein